MISYCLSCLRGINRNIIILPYECYIADLYNIDKAMIVRKFNKNITNLNKNSLI